MTDENWRRPEGVDCVHQRTPEDRLLDGGEDESLHVLSQRTYCRMNWTASSYFIPHSMRASATRTGALRGHTAIRRPAQNSGKTGEGRPEAHLPSPATQWTATQQPGSSLNFSFSRFSQSSTIWLEGGAPSSKGQSWGGREAVSPGSRKPAPEESRTSCLWGEGWGGGKQLGEPASCF